MAVPWALQADLRIRRSINFCPLRNLAASATTIYLIPSGISVALYLMCTLKCPSSASSYVLGCFRVCSWYAIRRPMIPSRLRWNCPPACFLILSTDVWDAYFSQFWGSAAFWSPVLRLSYGSVLPHVLLLYTTVDIAYILECPRRFTDCYVCFHLNWFRKRLTQATLLSWVENSTNWPDSFK